MVMTLGKFSLDSNLAKWLSRYEGAIHKGKDKRHCMVRMYANYKNKEES